MQRRPSGLPAAEQMMTHGKLVAGFGAAAVLAAFAVACGGGGSSNPAPSPTPTPTPGGNQGTTITITSSGVSPKTITVTRGSQVTFTNNDSGPHDMNSNPHPEHTDCPELNVGFLAAGQSKQSQNLNTARTCGYHDHNQPSNTALQGTIVIQ